MSGQQLFVPSSVGRSYKKERQTGRQRKNSGAVSLSPFVHSFVRSFARRQRESFDSVRLFFSLSSFFSFFLLLSFCLSVRARGSGANFGSNTISLSGRIGKRRSIPMKEDSERERRCSMAGKKAPLACSLQSEPCKLAQFRLASRGWRMYRSTTLFSSSFRRASERCRIFALGRSVWQSRSGEPH